MKLRLMTYLLIFTLLIGAAAASTWVDDPTDCPTTHQSQSCFDGNKLCGYDSGIVYCYDVSSLNPPSSDTTVSSTNIAGFDGGFLLDCESYDGSSPHCDNAGAYWCDRDSSCYDINRQTHNLL